MALLNGLIQKLQGPEDDPLAALKAGNTGVTGGLDKLQAAPIAPSAEPMVASPMAAPASPDFGRLVGYDAGKFNDPNKQSAKYQIGRTLAGFDPSKGLTPDVVAALNGLGFGTFSGQGDKLSLQGLTDKGRGAGLVGDYKDADFNVGFKTGNGKWGYADPAEEARQAAMGGGAPSMNAGRPSFAGSTIPNLLQADAQGGIQQALGKFGAVNDSGYLQKLIAALGGQA